MVCTIVSAEVGALSTCVTALLVRSFFGIISLGEYAYEWLLPLVLPPARLSEGGLLFHAPL
jgi:hypothetical protein